MQRSDKLRSAAGQTAPQASLQRHSLPHRDDLPAPSHHVGVLHLLGSITGKNLSFAPSTLPYDIKNPGCRLALQARFQGVGSARSCIFLTS